VGRAVPAGPSGRAGRAGRAGPLGQVVTRSRMAWSWNILPLDVIDPIMAHHVECGQQDGWSGSPGRWVWGSSRRGAAPAGQVPGGGGPSHQQGHAGSNPEDGDECEDVGLE